LVSVDQWLGTLDKVNDVIQKAVDILSVSSGFLGWLARDLKKLIKSIQIANVVNFLKTSIVSLKTNKTNLDALQIDVLIKQQVHVQEFSISFLVTKAHNFFFDTLRI
jgi:hypothetical protein